MIYYNEATPVELPRGSAQILKDINFRVEPKSKWALGWNQWMWHQWMWQIDIVKNHHGRIAYEATITVGTTQQVGYLRQTDTNHLGRSGICHDGYGTSASYFGTSASKTKTLQMTT
jgi:hypothetical protein